MRRKGRSIKGIDCPFYGTRVSNYRRFLYFAVSDTPPALFSEINSKKIRVILLLLNLLRFGLYGVRLGWLLCCFRLFLFLICFLGFVLRFFLRLRLVLEQI